MNIEKCQNNIIDSVFGQTIREKKISKTKNKLKSPKTTINESKYETEGKSLVDSLSEQGMLDDLFEDVYGDYDEDDNLNDEELNSLEYTISLQIDKRTFFQYYWSLLKKKQLILFTIIPSNDYNLISLKLALFLLSFSLYFTINGFFFTDETMHKVYEDKGAFNIIYQIPQIIYSSGVSSIINMILKMLSLSESNILILKQEKDFKIAKKKSKSIMNYLLIKFFFFKAPKKVSMLESSYLFFKPKPATPQILFDICALINKYK